VGFALKLVVIADHATVRADRAIRPANGLKVCAGCVVVVKVGSIQGGGHGDFLLLRAIIAPSLWFVKGIIAEIPPK
jgi:hypothetical protein